MGILDILDNCKFERTLITLNFYTFAFLVFIGFTASGVAIWRQDLEYLRQIYEASYMSIPLVILLHSAYRRIDE